MMAAQTSLTEGQTSLRFGQTSISTRAPGGGVPDTIIVNGVSYELLLGSDGQAIRSDDGQYLYGEMD